MDISSGKSIEITDKKLFDNYFQKYPPVTSELTFTNLFMWRDYYRFKFLEWQNHLLIYSIDYFKRWKKSISNNENAIFFLPPVGSTPAKIILDLFNSKNPIEIHRVPETITNKIKKDEAFNHLNLNLCEDRNNWDYLYDLESLITLPGNKFRQKRRWLNKFFEKYDYEFQIITEDEIDKTLRLQIEWWDANEGKSSEDLMDEQKAIVAALKHFTELDFKGGLICVDDKCVAYTLGEKLNNETLVIHIEKAHIEYEGSYQAVNNLFLKEFRGNAKFVNREQDLGLPGLRKAKEAYKPIRMIKKSIIYRKN
jgi:hypothetical protein